MKPIKYKTAGGSAWLEPNRLYRHVVSGSLHLLQSNGRLRDASAAEIEALERSGKTLDAMTKEELEAYAKESFGVDLDRRKTKDALLSEIADLAA